MSNVQICALIVVARSFAVGFKITINPFKCFNFAKCVPFLLLLLFNYWFWWMFYWWCSFFQRKTESLEMGIWNKNDWNGYLNSKAIYWVAIETVFNELLRIENVDTVSEQNKPITDYTLENRHQVMNNQVHAKLIKTAWCSKKKAAAINILPRSHSNIYQQQSQKFITAKCSGIYDCLNKS